jgi:hypothetical protein
MAALHRGHGHAVGRHLVLPDDPACWVADLRENAMEMPRLEVQFRENNYICITPRLHFDMRTLNVGEKIKIVSRGDGSETKEYFIVTSDNIEQANSYIKQPNREFEFLPIDSTVGYQKVTVGFNTILVLETEYSRGGSRRSKPSKKRSATRRRRSSKRMSRKMNKRRR